MSSVGYYGKRQGTPHALVTINRYSLEEIPVSLKHLANTETQTL